jgi:hypothetical protein
MDARPDLVTANRRLQVALSQALIVVNRWDEKAGLRRDAVRSQVIDALEAQEIKGDRQ